MRAISLGSAATAIAVLLASPTAAQAADKAPYQDTTLSPQARAADLVSRMTLEEKIRQMQSGAPAIPRLGIGAYNWWGEALHGVANGHATVFPQAIGLGATFDTDLVHRVADAISTEARAKYNEALRTKGAVAGNPVILPTDTTLTFWSPNVNIFRDPRWGRGQETYGEDPFLTGRIGTAFVTGMQGDDPRYLKTVSTPKHFAVHSGPEPLRHTFDAQVSDYDLENTYLPAFRTTVIDGKAESVMCVYNAVGGVPGCASADLLQKRLRDNWGFDGYVVSDCGAVGDIFYNHKFAKTMGGAAAAAVRAGTDLSCGTEYEALADEVKAGTISENEINRAVERLFVARFRLGMFDPASSVAYTRISASEIDSPAHRALALEAAEKAIVLLKNTKGVLPLASSVKRIAVVGPSADDVTALLGNYNGVSSNQVTPLEGIRQQFAGAEVRYAMGATYTESSPTPVPAALFTVPGGSENGLITEYFDNPDLAGEPNVRRTEQQIRFSRGTDDPAVSAVVKNDRYSIRWSATFTPPVSGKYLLAARTHMWNRGGRIRLYLDNKSVGTNAVLGPSAIPGAVPVETTRSQNADARVSLVGGRKYNIRVELRQEGGGGTINLGWVPPANVSLAEAKSLIDKSDVALVFVGLNSTLEGEENPSVKIPGFLGGDRTSIDLPKPQERLIETAISTGKPVVVVLTSGSALAVNYAHKHAAAVLEAWYGGEETGTAIARTLAGANNPSGRLPVTFYRGVNQIPAFTDYAMRGRTYRYFSGEPLYRFGHGLSYSTFRYSHLRTRREGTGAEITAMVTNTSKRDGDEVVQLYLAGIGQEIRNLRGFKRVHLKAGESTIVRFTLTDLPQTRIDVSVGGGQPTGATAHIAGVL
jgi:beta-glucosidase